VARRRVPDTRYTKRPRGRGDDLVAGFQVVDVEEGSAVGGSVAGDGGVARARRATAFLDMARPFLRSSTPTPATTISSRPMRGISSLATGSPSAKSGRGGGVTGGAVTGGAVVGGAVAGATVVGGRVVGAAVVGVVLCAGAEGRH
jgi:hypothetical protein